MERAASPHTLHREITFTLYPASATLAASTHTLHRNSSLARHLSSGLAALPFSASFWQKHPDFANATRLYQRGDRGTRKSGPKFSTNSACAFKLGFGRYSPCQASAKLSQPQALPSHPNNPPTVHYQKIPSKVESVKVENSNATFYTKFHGTQIQIPHGHRSPCSCLNPGTCSPVDLQVHARVEVVVQSPSTRWVRASE
jgi:hypothetical protein